uniref:Uncharacterized protein n=1 Tax=Chlorocebus sabaeus TaxID=60711 RepID=A0A0D9S2G6_CHLSB
MSFHNSQSWPQARQALSSSEGQGWRGSSTCLKNCSQRSKFRVSMKTNTLARVNRATEDRSDNHG